jgi:hypothetical protein
MIDRPGDAIPNKTGDPDPAERSNAAGRPQDRVIGDGPMSDAQASYLRALCAEAGVDFDASLSRAAGAERIAQLKTEIPRLAGVDGKPPQA